MPGSRIPIVDEARLRAERPDYRAHPAVEPARRNHGAARATSAWGARFVDRGADAWRSHDDRVFSTPSRSITELEVGYATDAARNGWGEHCYEYIIASRRFASISASAHVIATSSCTGALHMGWPRWASAQATR